MNFYFSVIRKSVGSFFSLVSKNIHKCADKLDEAAEKRQFPPTKISETKIVTPINVTPLERAYKM